MKKTWVALASVIAAIAFIPAAALANSGDLDEPKLANASMADQPCDEIGTTLPRADEHNTLACLYNKSHEMVWTDLLAQTQRSDSQAISANSPAQGSLSRTRWQGWHAGGKVGFADATSSFEPSNHGASTPDFHRYGATAGVVGGYNWVESGGLFYGVETDINYTSSSNTESYSGMKNAWSGYATARGRVGVAFDPALVFLSWGLALTDITDKWNTTYANIPYGFSGTTIHPGWTAGGLALAPNLPLPIISA